MKNYMKSYRKVILALAASIILSTAVQPKPANAGLILSPIGVGFVILVIGLIEHDRFLIILDADGSLSQSSLEVGFTRSYAFIDNQDAYRDLAKLVHERASTVVADADGSKRVNLRRSDILDVLAPTGLVELQPQLVEGLIKDLE